MIRIGIKEFRYQLDNWLGALAVFIAASLVSSSCLIIYFPLAPVVHHSEVTNALFITPLIWPRNPLCGNQRRHWNHWKSAR